MLDLMSFKDTKNISLNQVYSNPQLAHTLEMLEQSFLIVNEEQVFENLVNPSASNSHAYFRWARYREGYSGELVRELLIRSGLDLKRQFVFDPMCGSGATLVAASQLGFDCVGTDVNPYAVDLCNAKVRSYSETTLDSILEVVSKDMQTDQIPSATQRANFDDCQQYFRADQIEPLQRIATIISNVEDHDARFLLFVAWLTILEDCSERKKDGNGLATRPTKVTNTWLRFVHQVKLMIHDLRKHPLPSGISALALHRSAFDAPTVLEEFRRTSEKELGAIIFSPPYANSFDYFESYKLELLCGYYNNKELIQAREQAIRSYRKGYRGRLTTDNEIVRMLCDEIDIRIPLKENERGVKDNRSRLVPNLLIGYFQDMHKVIRCFESSMIRDTSCHIVVDQSSYLGVPIPTDLILAEVARSIGFDVEQITVCRRARTSAQQLNQYPYLKSILRESIITLRKK